MSGERRAKLPVFPQVDGLRVVFAERSERFTSSRRLGLVQTVAFTFRVTPLRAGSFVLPPAEIELPDGSVLKTEPIRIVAAPSGSMQSEKPLVATGQFNKTSAWEGEVVLYELELTAQVPVTNVRWGLPAFKGLSRPPHGDLVTQTRTIEDPQGDVTIISKTIPLVAAGTGDRTQPPSVVRADEVFERRGAWVQRRRTRTLPTEAEAPLRVRPLPKAPADFSGLVGEFELRSHLAKQTVGVGETVPWAVMITGDGVTDSYLLDDLKFPGARVYRDTSEVDGRLVDGRYRSTKTFRLQLVPTLPGTLNLPPLEVVVFSPKKGRYVKLNVEIGTLEVSGELSAEEMKSFSSDADVELPEPVELVDIYTFGFATLPPLAPILPLLLVLVSLPGGMLLVGEGASASRRRWKLWRASRKVEVRAQGRLQALPDEGSERLALLDLALREALADKAGVEVGALRRREALDSLSDGLRDRVERAFSSLDRCRFAGEAPDAELELMVRDAVAKLS